MIMQHWHRGTLPDYLVDVRKGYNAAMELVRFVPEAEVQGCLFSKTDDFPAAIPS
jgi:hypothetical protein